MTALLSVEALTKRFGGLTAVDAVTLAQGANAGDHLAARLARRGKHF